MNAGERGASPLKAWHQQDILAELRKRGTTVAALSRENGLSAGTFRTGFYRRYPKAQLAISGAIGVPVHELWPDWYEADGSLKPLQGANVKRIA